MNKLHLPLVVLALFSFNASCTSITPDQQNLAGKNDTEPATSAENYMPQVDVTKNMTPEVGYSELRIQPVPDLNNPTFVPSRSTTGGDFRIHCNASHMANDDFIVYPNQEGAAHHHTFFGNTKAYFNSTPDSIKDSGNSTCQGGIANRSAYWLPSLIDTTTHTPLKPDWALFYYKGGDTQPPNGLMMIAGDHLATEKNPQNIQHAQWQCNEKYTSRSRSIPACTGDLTAIVHFPQCWDGENLDSPNHKAHMSYGRNGRCPTTHPKKLPNISGIIHYKVENTDNLRIASDNYKGGKGGYSLHMDYVFGWKQSVIDKWWENCTTPKKDCHADLLGDGTWLY